MLLLSISPQVPVNAIRLHPVGQYAKLSHKEVELTVIALCRVEIMRELDRMCKWSLVVVKKNMIGNV